MRTRIKFCGLTNPADVDAAIAAGADALGFNTWRGSSRHVDDETCAELLTRVPPFVTTVGLFVNEPEPIVRRRVARLPFDLLQFHGDEDDAFCAAYETPYIKAIRVKSTADLERQAYNFPNARALLLDAAVDGAFGGTGEQFDWAIVRALGRDLDKPVILAGGLDPSNVARAIAVARPFAVDVSSGIERARGQKDPGCMNDFVAAVRAADGEH